jgi:hypothetical protein
VADPKRRYGVGKSQRHFGQHCTVEGKSALYLFIETGNQNVEPKPRGLCRDGSSKIRLCLDQYL